MLRRASILMGLALLLSLLFPVKALLLQGGVDPLVLQTPGVDLVVLCALVALLPAQALARHGKIALRVPRWNLWLALLLLFTLLFVALHVQWTLALAADLLREETPLPPEVVLQAAETVARFGVLAGVVGVLVNLRPVPTEDELLRMRRGSRRRKSK